MSESVKCDERKLEINSAKVLSKGIIQGILKKRELRQQLLDILSRLESLAKSVEGYSNKFVSATTRSAEVFDRIRELKSDIEQEQELLANLVAQTREQVSALKTATANKVCEESVAKFRAHCKEIERLSETISNAFLCKETPLEKFTENYLEVREMYHSMSARIHALS